MANFKTHPLDYVFELPTDEEIVETMKHGMSKPTAMMIVGNDKVLSQTKQIKSRHLLDNLDFLIDPYHNNSKVYYDKNVIDNINNINFLSAVGRQIFNLHLFGFKNIKIIEYTPSYLRIQVFKNINNEWQKAILTFFKLSNVDLTQLDAYHNIIFINDDIVSSLNKFKLIDNANHNLIISDNYHYEYQNNVYVGASFYLTNFFNELFNANKQNDIDQETINKMVDTEKEKVSQNHFVFENTTNLDVFTPALRQQYLHELFGTLSIQDVINYYPYYGQNNYSINQYLDTLIIQSAQRRDYESFAEYELNFALEFAANNTDALTNNNRQMDLDNQVGTMTTIIPDSTEPAIADNEKTDNDSLDNAASADEPQEPVDTEPEASANDNSDNEEHSDDTTAAEPDKSDDNDNVTIPDFGKAETPKIYTQTESGSKAILNDDKQSDNTDNQSSENAISDKLKNLLNNNTDEANTEEQPVENHILSDKNTENDDNSLDNDGKDMASQMLNSLFDNNEEQSETDKPAKEKHHDNDGQEPSNNDNHLILPGNNDNNGTTLNGVPLDDLQ